MSITEKVLIFLNEDAIDLVGAYLANGDSVEYMKYILPFSKYQTFKSMVHYIIHLVICG